MTASAMVTRAAIWIVRQATSRNTGVSMIRRKLSSVNSYTTSRVNGSVSQIDERSRTKSDPKYTTTIHPTGSASSAASRARGWR